MLRLKVFWKKDCPNCPKGKAVVTQVEKKGVEADYYDIETVEGLTDATFFTVLSTPSIIIVDENDNEVSAFRGEKEILTMEELENALGIKGGDLND